MKKMLLIALFALTAAGFAADQKVAVVDLDRVLQEYYKTKIVEANLKRQADVYKDYAQKLMESLTKLQNEFTALRDAAQNIALTDAARESKRLAAQDKYKEIAAKELELRTYNREKQAQLRDDRDRERAVILDDIKKAVENHATLAGFSLVLDKAALSASGMPVILYNSKAIEISEPVLKELNTGRAAGNNPGAYHHENIYSRTTRSSRQRHRCRRQPADRFRRELPQTCHRGRCVVSRFHETPQAV